MIHSLKNKLLLIVFLFGIQSIFAFDYYCDPTNGSMNNDGSEENPWSDLASVFKEGKKFEAGDNLFLLSGNHGDVIVVGENSKYIKVEGVEGKQPILNSIVFGTNELKAARWTFSNILFESESEKNTVLVHENSFKIRILSNEFSSKKGNDIGLIIKGSQCKIENNIFKNFSSAIKIIGQKNQIRNNKITFFNKNAIEVSGDFNLFEYNLIKESVAVKGYNNNGFHFITEVSKGNIIRGNTIINFISSQRKDLGILNGIYSNDCTISETIIENNVIISNGDNGISLNGKINNSKIVNNTVVNPYFGLDVLSTKEINTLNSIKLIGEDDSTGLVVRNNLTNNLVFENVKGVSDHNLVLPVSVHDFDLCFKNWAKFDFSLSENSKALNNGASELAPKLDASLNSRSLGNFVNIGAFEFAKINEENETLIITSEKSDRQIHSKGKADWDGQPQIRIGGVGEGIDGAGIFPFELPLIPGGKEIVSLDFKVFLKKVDNKPEGGIDLYALAPKSNFWVTEDMYYQGTYGQDLNARPIQNNFNGSKHFGGEIKASNEGSIGLINYINTVYENGSKVGDYIFLRMNSNSKDVTDYNRWSFISSNSDKVDKHPQLEIVIGYPAINNKNTANAKTVKNTIVAKADPINTGNFNLYFLGFENSSIVDVSILTTKGIEVFNKEISVSNLLNKQYESKKLSLPIGKYFLQYSLGQEIKKQTIFIW